nr:hypothetical protein GCM10025730_07930 [Promicromonospora thailandica]
MGATGQPDSSGRRGRGGPRPWWEDYRTTVLTVLVAVAGLCTTAMGVVGREAQIVLLVVSVALVLLGLAALVRVPTYARWFAAAGRWAVRRWTVVLPVVLVVTTGAGLGLLWLQRERSCDDAAEIAVVVPEDGAADFSAVADAFERDSVNTFSCPSYHVTTFGMGWPALRAALVSGWDEGSSEEPGASLALGPRPDVWIAESTAQAALVTQEAGSAVTAAEPVPVAGSPLVLAVPAPYAQGLRATTTSDDPVRVLVDAAEAVGLDVVRANPDTSFAAALHSVSLYDGTVADAEALELSLGHALERAGLPFGSDGALLCRLAELSAATAEPPRVAVLTTERAAVTGGADCPAVPGAGTGAELVPFYPEGGPGLEYAAVRLDWAPAPGGRGEQGAEAFVRWLTTPRGQAVLESRARVRDLNGQPLSGLDGLLAGSPSWRCRAAAAWGTPASGAPRTCTARPGARRASWCSWTPRPPWGGPPTASATAWTWPGAACSRRSATWAGPTRWASGRSPARPATARGRCST